MGRKAAGAETVGPCGMGTGRKGKIAGKLIEDYQPFSIAESHRERATDPIRRRTCDRHQGRRAGADSNEAGRRAEEKGVRKSS